MHAAGIGDTLGIGLLGLGAILLGPSWILRLKILIILFLFWIVNPTMTHLIAKAALIEGTQPTKRLSLGGNEHMNFIAADYWIMFSAHPDNSILSHVFY